MRTVLRSLVSLGGLFALASCASAPARQDAPFDVALCNGTITRGVDCSRGQEPVTAPESGSPPVATAVHDSAHKDLVERASADRESAEHTERPSGRMGGGSKPPHK